MPRSVPLFLIYSNYSLSYLYLDYFSSRKIHFLNLKAEYKYYSCNFFRYANPNMTQIFMIHNL